MQVGDIVRWRTPFDTLNWSADEIGLVIDIINWVVSDTPDRSFGSDVLVLWSTGEIKTFFADELETINENNS